MFGLFALVVSAGIFAGVVGVDSYRRQEYERKQSDAKKRWQEANDAFFSKATNRSMETDFEPKLRKIMFGSKDYPEIIDEIKSTYKKWLNEEPWYITYLGVGNSSYGNTFNYIFEVLLAILMANRGYITTGAAVGGVSYNPVMPSEQAEYFARKLDSMLQKKGIHEDLYYRNFMGNPQMLTCCNQMGYSGYIYWKPEDPSLYL